MVSVSDLKLNARGPGFESRWGTVKFSDEFVNINYYHV